MPLRGVAAIWTAIVLASGMAGGPALAAVTTASYDLTFETSGQSIWSTGNSFQLDKTNFLGAQWDDQLLHVGGIIGDESSLIPNPARAAYDVALAACTLINSRSACINGQAGQAPVPALGSRPGVRSCGTFAFACQAARLGDIARRAAYDTAYAACTLSFSGSVCRNGQPLKLPVAPLGNAPAPFLNIDTRTGAELSAITDGRVGLELGVKIDSGSVDAKVSYNATLDIPDTAGLDKANPIQFNPNSLLSGENTLNTSFSSVSLSVDAIMELSGNVSAAGCIVLAGCIGAQSNFDIHEKAPVLSFNQDNQGGILLFGNPPSIYGLPGIANGFPVSLDVAGLAEITLYLPQPNASGGLDNTTQTLKATGQDDFVDLILDVDNIIASSVGLPGLFGRSFDVGDVGEVGYDIINVGMGPTIDLQQDFELDPTLFVSLAFDQAVMIGGQIVTTLVSAWDSLPAITFLSDVTHVTPTFFLQADLANHTLLDFDLQFLIDLLQINYDLVVLGDGSIGIGNVLDKSVDLFDTPDLFSNIFPLQGFNLQIGDAFEINFLSGSSAPADSRARSAVNQIVLAGDVNPTIPEPGSLPLVLLAVVMAFAWAARSQSRRRVSA